MKRIAICTMILLTGLAFSNQTKAQGFEPGVGFKQFNFGVGASGWGVPVYGSLDFGIADKITIGPWASFRTNGDVTVFTFAGRGDYHYGGHIPGLPEELDLYGGLSLGFSTINYDNDLIDNTTDVDLWLQAGARWYWSPTWGVMGEFNAGSEGNLAGAMVGLSVRF